MDLTKTQVEEIKSRAAACKLALSFMPDEGDRMLILPDEVTALCTLALRGLEVQWRPDQVKHMVDRFLGWQLPADFAPDNGISFDATYNKWMDKPPLRNPTGTNLFTSDQAKAMVLHMLEGLPSALPAPPEGK